MKKTLFWAFWGPAKVPRPLVITKVGAGSEKSPKMELAALAGPKCPDRTLGQISAATDPFVYFFARTTEDKFLYFRNKILAFWDFWKYC
jgi:hypothetical protein